MEEQEKDLRPRISDYVQGMKKNNEISRAPSVKGIDGFLIKAIRIVIWVMLLALVALCLSHILSPARACYNAVPTGLILERQECALPGSAFHALLFLATAPVYFVARFISPRRMIAEINVALIIFLAMITIHWTFKIVAEDGVIMSKYRFASDKQIQAFIPSSHSVNIPVNLNTDGLLYNLIIEPKEKYYDDIVPDGSLRISRDIYSLYNLRRLPSIPLITRVPPKDRRNDATWFEMGSFGHAPGKYVVKLEASEGACTKKGLFSSRITCNHPRITLSEDEIEIVDATEYRTSTVSRFLGYQSFFKAKDLIGIPDLDRRRDWMLADWRPAHLDVTVTDARICTLQKYPDPLPGTITACIDLGGHFGEGDIYAPQDIDFTITGMEYASNIVPFEYAESQALEVSGEGDTKRFPRFRYRSEGSGGHWLFEMRQARNTIAIMNDGSVCRKEEKDQSPSCSEVIYEICDGDSYRCGGRSKASLF